MRPRCASILASNFLEYSVFFVAGGSSSATRRNSVERSRTVSTSYRRLLIFPARARMSSVTLATCLSTPTLPV